MGRNSDVDFFQFFILIIDFIDFRSDLRLYKIGLIFFSVYQEVDGVFFSWFERNRVCYHVRTSGCILCCCDCRAFIGNKGDYCLFIG